MEATFKKYILSINELDNKAMEETKKYQNSLAKPPKSLGALEDLSIQIAGITGKTFNTLLKKHLLVFAADNGVCEEGVSSAPQSVTLKQSINLTEYKTGAGVLAKHFGCEITVCDVGIKADTHNENIIDKKISYGTKNILKGPAMTRDEAIKAIITGIELVRDIDADIYGVGEMGIGNTTTASAVLSVLESLEVNEVTGKGGGLTDEAFLHKKEVIRKAILINQPNKNDIIDVLSKVGGFDIAAMCGAFIGGGIYKKPMVIDGFISMVAALCAIKLCPKLKGYLIPSHNSFELGYKKVMDALNLSPYLNLNMRLGEGSGCPLMFEIIDAALSIVNNMSTFKNADINDDYLNEIRLGDKFSV